MVGVVKKSEEEEKGGLNSFFSRLFFWRKKSLGVEEFQSLEEELGRKLDVAWRELSELKLNGSDLELVKSKESEVMLIRKKLEDVVRKRTVIEQERRDAKKKQEKSGVQSTTE